jgi:membrane protein
VSGRSGTLTVSGLRAFVHRLERTFVGRCVRSFVDLQGLDRAVVLASQAFTALIPLLLLVAALAPAGRRDGVAGALIGRFRLSGDAADAVRQLFAHPGDGSIGVFSVLLLLFSCISLTRRMQRMYQQAWRLEPLRGAGPAFNAALGLTVLVLGISLQCLVRALPLGAVLMTPLSALVNFLLWAAVPWLLLDRRVGWRRLLPIGALTAVCTSVYGFASTIYMPRLLDSYSRRYGLFGVTLALIGWLLAIAFIVVAATATAAEIDRAQDPWARRLRRRLGIEPAAVGARPPEASLPARPVPPQPSSGRPPAGPSSVPAIPVAGTRAHPQGGPAAQDRLS